MALSVQEKISSREKKEFKKLRKRSRSAYSLIRWVFFIGFSCVVSLLVLLAVTQGSGRGTWGSAATSSDVREQITSTQEELSTWLAGIPGGSPGLFDALSRPVLLLVSELVGNEDPRQRVGLATQVCCGALEGVLRATFLVVAWWRLWLLAALGAGYIGYVVWKPYLADDFLGTCTNGRLFYSGIRADLRKATPDGAPDVQVQGLACPKSKPASEVKTSPLGEVLERYGVANDTNLELAGIVLEHSSYPAYVAERTERALLDQAFSGATLDENAANLLEAVLSVHAAYQSGDFSGPSPVEASYPLSSHEYCELLKPALHRVLSHEMLEKLTEVSPAALATVTLALEAGKVMAYGFEAGRWTRISRFPQLSARAILHSVSPYSREYTYEERNNIRRAIIYGSRVSIFAPVKLAVNLSPECRAMRQWVEILMGCPHELESVGDDVELAGLVEELHGDWVNGLFDWVMVRGPLEVPGACAYGQTFYLPLPKVMELVRKTIRPEMLSRVEELIIRVSQRQQLMSAGTDGDQKETVPVYERVFPPISETEIKRLSAEHGLNKKEIYQWSSVRVVLNAFGWLGRRVGDYTVPESSLIFLTVGESAAVANGYLDITKLQGFKGMVPFRATRLKDKWGSGWSDRFLNIEYVRMSETPEEFAQALQGIEEAAEEEPGITA